MTVFFLALFSAIIILLLFRFVKYRKSIDKQTKYICNECGEKDCVCYKESDIKIGDD